MINDHCHHDHGHLKMLGSFRGEEGDVGELLHLDLVLQVLNVVAYHNLRVHSVYVKYMLGVFSVYIQCMLSVFSVYFKCIFSVFTDSVSCPPVGQF